MALPSAGGCRWLIQATRARHERARARLRYLLALAQPRMPAVGRGHATRRRALELRALQHDGHVEESGDRADARARRHYTPAAARAYAAAGGLFGCGAEGRARRTGARGCQVGGNDAAIAYFSAHGLQGEGAPDCARPLRSLRVDPRVRSTRRRRRARDGFVRARHAGARLRLQRCRTRTSTTRCARRRTRRASRRWPTGSRGPTYAHVAHVVRVAVAW
jgi:hypothetical protein